ncbi:hypothetical protein MHYP_G00181020 [Metynnis hypsauchen]
MSLEEESTERGQQPLTYSLAPMGTLTMLQVWVLSMAALLNGASAQQTGINVNHNMQVCSTWGNFHFSTFDGQLFQLPYTCNYILTTLCDSTKTDFNIQMRRRYINNLPTISSFTIKIQGAVVQLQSGNITMNQKIVDIPSYQNGISIERGTSFIKIGSKTGLTVFWDERNSLSIEISTKYRNQTCGLCGDFNGDKNNEFNENDKDCPFNLEHKECGNPCKDSCSNQEESQVDNVTVLANLVQCGQTDTETCLTDIKFIIPTATADDFKTESGLKEGTAATFANMWKAMTTCPDVSNCHQDPCSMSVEKERFAKEWCTLLTDPEGVFSPCHIVVNPSPYRARCIYDACKCARSDACMCAAVSSYAYACAAEGVLLQGWRNTTCGKFSQDCPGNMEYHYSLRSCGTTCRSLSGFDYTCKVSHTPVDGCGCAKGTYLNDKGDCVPASSCPCYYNNQVVAPSQVISKDGTTCTCTHGKLDCLGELQIDCPAPMYYFNCSNAGPGAKGVECQKSCQTLDSDQCDYCGNSLSGSFRIITENIPCGTTGTTCSRSVKLFLGNKEFLLADETVKVFVNDNGTEIDHKVYTVGIYFVIETGNGLVLHWDKKTSLKITLDPLFKRKVCGLCGNYDGNGKNDFVTRGGEEVVDPLEFGNSWRISSACPKASIISSPCSMRPHRQAWAIKQCSIIKSDVFKSCHSSVDPDQYYDVCVQDTCACDTGGDCECFCTAVAAYAAACNGKGACISWRTPTICREPQ